MANTLYDKIEAKGEADAKRILEAAADKAAQLREAARAAAVAEGARRLQEAERLASDRLRGARTEATRAAKKATLEHRKEILDGVFTAASAAIAALDDDGYRRLVVRLLASEKLSGGERFVVAANARDRFLRLFSSAGDGILDRLAKDLGTPGMTFTLDPAAAPIDGGFLVVGADYDIDRSHRAILTDLRGGLEPELAELLFGAGE